MRSIIILFPQFFNSSHTFLGLPLKLAAKWGKWRLHLWPIYCLSNTISRYLSKAWIFYVNLFSKISLYKVTTFLVTSWIQILQNKQTLTIQSFRHTIQPKSGSWPSESDGRSDRSNSSVASTVIVYENDTDNNEMTVAKIQAVIMFASNGQLVKFSKSHSE